MGKFIDMSGQRFGRLLVVCRTDNHIQPNGVSVVMWKCKCDCGNEVIISGVSLRKGLTKSCGCLHKECATDLGHKNKKYNTYNLSGEYGIGYTSKGEEFYFDLEDYDKIKNYCWFISDSGYVMTNDNKTRELIRFHRLILPVNKNDQVDHIKHKTNDNRKSELRIVTGTQNNMNRSIQSNNTSGVTGIYWDKSKQRWCSEIMVNRKKIYLGVYKDFNKAIQARKEAEEKYFGKHSYDNSMNS
jgi:hypothetical protein